MVSIPCSYYAAARLPQFPYLAETRFPNFIIPARFHRFRSASSPIIAVGDRFSGTDPLGGRSPASRTLFPGGFKRPEIKIPCLVLRLSADEVFRCDNAGFAFGEAVSKGVGIVVLDFGEERGDRFYEAACLLKSLLGDRAYLLISERVDVAAAIGASGVVLSDQGIPAILARNMLLKSRSDTVFLPIVAKSVHNPVSAEHAASSDGADFIIISNGDGNWKSAFDLSAVQHVNLPIFLNMDFSVDSLATDFVSKSLKLGASGVVMSINSLMLFSNGFLEKIFLAEHEPIRLSRDEYEKPTEAKIDGSSSLASMLNVLRGIAGFVKLDDKEKKLLEVESLLLQEAVAVIRKAAPTVNF